MNSKSLRVGSLGPGVGAPSFKPFALPRRQIPLAEMKMGSEHPSLDVKTPCNLEPRILPKIIRSRHAESTCFKGSRTSCDVTMFGFFANIFGQKRSHHVMDAPCREKL